MNRDEILKILKEYRKKKGKQYGIKKLGLFGSCARGAAIEVSDIDIVIELERPDMFLMVHIKEELEQLLKVKVDIVRNRPKMNPYLKKHIEAEAIYV